MKNHFIFLFLLVFSGTTVFSQAPSCPSNFVYIHNSPQIQQQSVNPLGPAATVVLSSMPAGSGGLAVGPAFGFPAPNPTWWTTSGGTFWYYNNTGTWSNTGHSTSNASAVNIGGGGGAIYNLVGSTGQVYKYTGAGAATLLVTIPTFGGGGPYDLVADMNDNWYILKTNGPQNMQVYNSAGVLLCSYTLANAPVSSAGGGFAIINNTVYYTNAGAHAGNIIPGNSTITFTPVTLNGGGDWANCALPVPTSSIIAPQGGTLTCSLPSLQLVAMINPNGAVGMLSVTPASTLNVCTYTWSGPGIIAGQFTPTITVNQPGVYSYTTCTGSCPSYSLNNSYTVVGQPSVLNPTITAPTCMSGNAVLSVMPNNTATNTILWSGPGITSGQGTATININSAGLYSVTITAVSSPCAGTATINVLANPTLAMAYSSPTVCAQNLNNSPNSITLTASGASNYTLLTSSNYASSSSSISPMVLTPVGPFSSNPSVATSTLIGTNGVCSATITSNFSILPNPTVTVTPTATSVCQGNNFTFNASGAANYIWSPATGLNTTTGSAVIASPAITTVYSVMGSSLGCNAAIQTATLTVLPIPTVAITPNTPTICVGGNINLTANSNATTFNWSPSLGLNNTTNAVVTANPPSTQTYTVLVNLSSCTNTAVVTVSVIVVPNLLTNVSAPIICQGQNTNINVNGATGYNWSPTTGLNTSTGPFVIASPAVSTNYIITGFNGVCTASASVFIDVVPAPNITITSPEYQICYGKSTQITASGAQNFTWSPSSAGLSSTTGSVVTATPSANVNYTIIGYNQSGSVTCTQQMSYSVIVVPIAVALVSPSVAICEGAKTMLTASGGNTVIWSPTVGLNTSSGGGVIASPSVSTLYTVDVSYDGFCGGSNTVFVKVNPNPKVTAGRDTTINLDQPMFLSATGTGTMTWTDGEAIMCSVCPNSQVFATRNSCYTIETINDFGCKAKDDMCIEVTKEFGVYIPNAFSPNGDGLNDEFIISGYNISEVTMDIFDRWGEKIFTSKDMLVGWKGTYKNILCEEAVYIYKISYKGLDGKKVNKTGHVTLNK
ncbi:MAG: gliding motility-associated C-terminal domain-containing protein [Bacteroidetes bacterium]|nr:gliding motility-associated C-terminal domain-containing protein [Bacteroidota bacterium]